MQQVFANPFASYLETKNSIANARMADQQNAMQMEQFRMQQQEAQARMEAKRRAEETAALQSRGAQARYGDMFQNGQPMQSLQPAMPAPSSRIMAQQPEIDTATGRPIDLAIVQGQNRQTPSKSEAIRREMEVYAQANRWDLVGQLAPMFDEAVKSERDAGLAEEQQGYDLNTKTYEGIAQWAVLAMPQIARIPNEPGWDRQVMAMVQDAAARLNRMGLDGNLLLQEAKIQPGDTPQSIAAELDQLISQMGGPDAIKSRFSTSQVNAGDRIVTRTDAGSIVGTDMVGIDPADIFKERQANARNAADNATSERNSRRSAGSDATKPPTGYVLNPPPVGGR